MVLVLGGVAFAGFWFRMNIRLRFSEPYRIALEQVQGDSQVIERLGEPVGCATLLPSGSLDDRGGTVIFSVSGPKGEAAVHAWARRIGEAWGLTKLNVTFGDNQRLSLDVSSTGGGEAAPKFKPSTETQSAPEKVPAVGPIPDLDTDIEVEVPEIPKLPVE